LRQFKNGDSGKVLSWELKEFQVVTLGEDMDLTLYLKNKINLLPFKLINTMQTLFQKITIKLILFFVFTTIITNHITAQTTTQSPEEFLNFKKGERFLRHHQVVSYYEYIARQYPNQVKMIPYGSTNEGRPLMVVVIASTENFTQLEEIRTNNLKSIGLMEGY
jgi:hypothetical protein